MKKLLIILMAIGCFYRFYGLNANYSFWTDENHVAVFARAILERGRPVLANGYSTGAYHWLQYWLSAISAKIFGLNEFSIRFPSVIFGVLTIGAVYLLGQKLFNEKVGLVAALLITFLKIEILWSRQARPYQALQFFYLLSAYCLYQLQEAKKFSWPSFLGFLASGTLASLMHAPGLLIFFNGFLYLLVLRFPWFKKKAVIIAIPLVGFLSYFFRFHISAILANLGKINNLFYYRVLLWHNYSLLVFLALVGLLHQLFQRKNSWLITTLFLFVQGLIVSFFLAQPFVRYFYPVFPFLVLLSALGLVESSRIFKSKNLVLIILTFFIIAMGHKFTLKPRRVYSLNEDMQELPEVDWEKVYHFVGQKMDQDQEIVLVANWNDLPIWFLGEEKLDYFLRRPVEKRPERDSLSSAVLIYSLKEFQDIVRDNEKGILVIDSWDNMVPDGIREYARDNLKKGLEVDRLYDVQPRYWPVEIYSWGIEEE
jgi:hypothetical protein